MALLCSRCKHLSEHQGCLCVCHVVQDAVNQLNVDQLNVDTFLEPRTIRMDFDEALTPEQRTGLEAAASFEIRFVPDPTSITLGPFILLKKEVHDRRVQLLRDLYEGKGAILSYELWGRLCAEVEKLP